MKFTEIITFNVDPSWNNFIKYLTANVKTLVSWYCCYDGEAVILTLFGEICLARKLLSCQVTIIVTILNSFIANNLLFILTFTKSLVTQNCQTPSPGPGQSPILSLRESQISNLRVKSQKGPELMLVYFYSLSAQTLKEDIGLSGDRREEVLRFQYLKVLGSTSGVWSSQGHI